LSEKDSIMFDIQESAQLPQNAFVKDASEFLLDHYNQRGGKKFVYHNYTRAKQLAQIAFELGQDEAVQKDEMESLILAAYFLESHFIAPKDFSSNLEVWEAFRNEMEYDHTTLIRVPALLTHFSDKERKSRLVNLLRDAQLAAELANYQETIPFLKLEEEIIAQSRIKNPVFYNTQFERLQDRQMLSESGKDRYESLRVEHMLWLKNKVDKAGWKQADLTEASMDGLSKPFEGIEKKIPNSAIQTFFRTNYRNHINLSAIADNKANIMISVNAILISVVISIMSYQNLAETNPMVLLPVVIFLVTAMASLIFAVLSIRPKVTSLNEEEQDIQKINKNVIFFGNFVNLELDEYEEAVDAMLRDGELLYGNMTRDIYFLGQVLDKKYRFLTVAYNTFMVGFISTVLSFFMILFF